MYELTATAAANRQRECWWDFDFGLEASQASVLSKVVWEGANAEALGRGGRTDDLPVGLDVNHPWFRVHRVTIGDRRINSENPSVERRLAAKLGISVRSAQTLRGLAHGLDQDVERVWVVDGAYLMIRLALDGIGP